MSGIGELGRDVTITTGGVNIKGRQSKGISVNNEPIDVTDDDSSGFRELMALPGLKSVDLPISGVIKNREIMNSLIKDSSESQMFAVTITYTDGSTLSGNFFWQSYSETGEANGAYTFDSTLLSSGKPTFTPGT